MKKYALITLTGFAVLMTPPAFAFQCLLDMKKIDQAIAGGSDLSSDQLAEVKELRAKGEDLHKSG